MQGRIFNFAPLVAVAIALGAAGCARAQASAVAPPPALDVPAPPPRVIETVEAEPPPSLPADDAARPATPAVRPRPVLPPPPPPRAEAPKPEPPKPEPPRPEPEAPPKAAEEPPKPAAPPATLQTRPAVSESELERSIRVTLARAAADLSRIDYRALNADARTQYDTAKRFIQQADEALRMKNAVFAKNLADKAGTLAAQLGGR
jgi:hypothetical protein